MRIQTTDGRFHRIEENLWWDSWGIDLVPEEQALSCLDEGVGIAVISDDPEPVDVVAAYQIWDVKKI